MESIGIRTRRTLPRSVMLAFPVMLTAAVLSASLPAPRSAFAYVGESPPADGDLSVLTYNVKGLPWPAGFGRETALTAISTRLRDLRRANRQPHVVLLQEAFTDAAKRIGRDSGYRYIVSGPGRDMSAVSEARRDAAFLRDASPFKGETLGKFTDSGLQILSDYPILEVRRAAFPTDACAGFDCLANKGVLMVLLAVPGSPMPIAVVNTHFNARKASGVGPERSFAAYRRQMAALDAFLAANIPAGAPVVIAGDFNVGRDIERRTLMQATVARWQGHSDIAAAKGVLAGCIDSSAPCGADLPADAHTSVARNKDWQIMLPGRSALLAPQRIAVPFGREKDGSMLSDHIGYTVHYAVSGSQRMASRT